MQLSALRVPAWCQTQWVNLIQKAEQECWNLQRNMGKIKLCRLKYTFRQESTTSLGDIFCENCGFPLNCYTLASFHTPTHWSLSLMLLPDTSLGILPLLSHQKPCSHLPFSAKFHSNPTVLPPFPAKGVLPTNCRTQNITKHQWWLRLTSASNVIDEIWYPATILQPSCQPSFPSHSWSGRNFYPLLPVFGYF